MRKVAQIISGGAMLAALASPALAQSSATATATGTATIVQALTINKTADLAFGTIVKPTSGSATVSVAPTGNTRTISGGTGAALAGGTPTSAAFTVVGEGAQHFSIGIPASFPLITGTNTLMVTTNNPTGTTGVLGGTIGSPGSLTLGLGGSLIVASGAASGAYTGSVVVTVAYN